MCRPGNAYWRYCLLSWKRQAFCADHVGIEISCGGVFVGAEVEKGVIGILVEDDFANIFAPLADVVSPDFWIDGNVGAFAEGRGSYITRVSCSNQSILKPFWRWTIQASNPFALSTSTCR